MIEEGFRYIMKQLMFIDYQKNILCVLCVL